MPRRILVRVTPRLLGELLARALRKAEAGDVEFLAVSDPLPRDAVFDVAIVTAEPEGLRADVVIVLPQASAREGIVRFRGRAAERVRLGKPADVIALVTAVRPSARRPQ
jgi:hypothetical protein